MAFEDMRKLRQRGRKLLFTRESDCLQELLAKLRQESRRTLTLWALACAEEPVRLLAARYPEDSRPAQALHWSTLWAQGALKMPLARQAILQVHAMAREVRTPADEALCHAVGQACSSVHAEDHAIGLALYELTAIVRELGPDSCEATLESRLAAYTACLDRSRQEASEPGRPWAPFLLEDNGPNREQRRFERHSIPR